MYGINPTDFDEFDTADLEHDRIDMRIIIRQRLADRTAFHPDVEVAVEETVDRLLELRDDGLTLDSHQVDSVIREHADYDPETQADDLESVA